MKAPSENIQSLLQRGRDIIVFATELLGLRLNKAQVRWLRYSAAVQDGWRWAWKRTIHVAANQIGKTLGLAVLILWACIYKIGTDNTNVDAWTKAPYLWFHLAPTQQQAYHALTAAKQLIKGSHLAQVDKVSLPAGLVWEAKVATYYDGLEFINGAVCQFRSMDDKADALQGYTVDAISVDEAAFEDHLNTIVNETLMMRLIARGGPLILISTPNGMNDYFDLVEEVRRLNESPEERVWVDQDARSVVCWSVITDNVGYGISQDEVDRMESTLDPATKEQQLRGAFLEPSEAFFVPGDAILKVFTKNLPAEQPPKPGHRYVIFWDPSIASDPTACIVLDVTQKPWLGVAFRHFPRPKALPELLNEMHSLHLLYGSATHPQNLVPRSKVLTGYDATSMGGSMFQQLLRGIQPSRALNFGGPDKKLKSLTATRAVMTNGGLLLPDAWTRVRQEVLNYRLKDDKLRQDCVMALTGAVDIANSSVSVGQSIPMRIQARTTPTQPWR